MCGHMVFLGVIFGSQWAVWYQPTEYSRGTRDIGLGRVSIKFCIMVTVHMHNCVCNIYVCQY